MFSYGTGFWTTVIATLIFGGGAFAVWGFTSDRLPLGLIGVLLAGLGIYLLVVKFSDIADEFRHRWGGMR